MIRQILLWTTIAIFFSLSVSSCSGLFSDKKSIKGKKVFRYNQTGGLTSLDPAFSRNRANIWAVSQIYNGLITLNENLDAVPELAKEFDVSEDGLVYTFNLRTDVRFHDNPCFKETNGRGRNIVAQDFVYSFKRILEDKVGSTGKWVFEDKVLLGADGKSPSDTCFVAVNDSTFRINLKTKSPVFLQILAMPYAFVVPKEAVDEYGKEFEQNPVGTGPFTFVKWDRNQTLNLAKNANYWKEDKATGKKLPFLDAIQVSFVDNADLAFLSFQEGELEFLTSISAASKDQILDKNGKIKDAFQGKFQIDRVDYLNTEYVGFLLEGTDEKKNPLLNKKVRQALSYAVNREELISFLRNGLGVAGNYGFVPHALPSFDTTMVTGYGFNLRKAQELLKEAGYPNGQGLGPITLNSYSSDKEIAEKLQNDWEKLGIKVSIEQNQFSAHQQMVDNGKVSFFRGSWLGDYPDGENFLRLFYGKKENFAPNGPNKTHFNNEAYNKLFETAHEQTNLFDRYKTYQRMDSLLMSDAPAIVLYYDEVVQLKQNYVTGLKANIMNTLILESVDLKDPEEAKKEETAKK